MEGAGSYCDEDNHGVHAGKSHEKRLSRSDDFTSMALGQISMEILYTLSREILIQ